MMNKFKWTVAQFISVGALFLTGLASAYDKDEEQEKLDANKAKWDSFIGESGCGYTMIFKRSVMVIEYTGPFLAVINSNKDVVSAIYLNTSDAAELAGTKVTDTETLSWLTTVEGAFDEIQGALGQDAYSVEVKYDAVAGYPTFVSIDHELEIVDEETKFWIEDIVTL